MIVLSEKLAFTLRPGHSFRSFLAIRNEGSDKMGFKIKTTKPQRYTVKPTHGLLSPGASMNISVKMMRPEVDNILQDGEVCKDRFLVQYFLLDDTEFDQIGKLSSKEVISEINNLLSTKDKSAITNKKVNVQWDIAQRLPNIPSSPEREAQLAGTGTSSLNGSSTQNSSYMAGPGPSSDYDGGSAAAVDYAQYRQKYDQQVKMAAALQEEAASLRYSLNALQGELQREDKLIHSLKSNLDSQHGTPPQQLQAPGQSPSKHGGTAGASAGAGGGGAAAAVSKMAGRPRRRGGFSLLVIVLAALMAFFCGQVANTAPVERFILSLLLGQDDPAANMTTSTTTTTTTPVTAPATVVDGGHHLAPAATAAVVPDMVSIGQPAVEQSGEL